MRTNRLTAAQAIVRFLASQYTERDGVEQPLFAGMFGIFGHGNVSGLGQALAEYRHELTYFRAQNEQAMVHTSIAFARMKNRLQTFACTSSVGPGATNMVTGAATATVNRLPVLLLPGDTFANRRPHPVLQQLEYPLGQDVSVNDCFRPVSRFWDRINRPEQILASLPEAIRVLTDPAETGAVTIALPEDVQTEALAVPTQFLEKRVHRVVRQPAAPDSLREAAAMIARSTRPLIVAGGGVLYSEASGPLAHFAERFGIPVVTTQTGNSALPWDSPWNAGPIGPNGGIAANRLAASADLVIAIGTRLADFTTASRTAFQHPDVQFLAINVASFDAHKAGAFPVIGDARLALESLHPLLEVARYRTEPEYGDELERLKAEWKRTTDTLRQPHRAEQLTQAQAIGLVNEAAHARDIVVCAAGGMPGDLLRLWRTTEPHGYHVEYGYSCMGYEIAGGLGVKMADPSREVYVMVGDGSYLMLHTEIVTSLMERMKLIIVVVDNSGYQCIRSLQQACGSPSFGNELRARDAESQTLAGEVLPIDFAKNAESLGAVGLRAESASELRSALDHARQTDRTTVIHVPVDRYANVPGFESWWDVPIAEVSTDPVVRSAREEYEERLALQRYYG